MKRPQSIRARGTETRENLRPVEGLERRHGVNDFRTLLLSIVRSMVELRNLKSLGQAVQISIVESRKGILQSRGLCKIL